jgi:hypothetical protein
MEGIMMIGTSYFVSRLKAYEYYKAYGCTVQNVDTKIAEGEIHIGQPPLKAGENLVIIDNGTRYAIQQEERTRP